MNKEKTNQASANAQEDKENQNIGQENEECLTEEIDPVDHLQRLREEIEEHKFKAEDYYAQMQRLKAEFDNFRKRTQKEKEDTARYASERVIQSLLPVLDNFERAIASSRKNKDFEALSQGVEMIERMFVKVLEDEGLRIIETVGQEFDPNLHEALLKEESDQPENMILEELQKGYYLKDKVIRPSRVKVSG
ncbi:MULTISPECIES: nucleotide exchange factor GrpE [Dehalobacter]|uniref:Protein GrpE n=2 Tax=Dehalobacter restrictus TaxID=55583 RepID=A0A857DHN0_9FIRM|nr:MULTISPECIES: nucleotide exchange factor GrpE [Dehalobacter]AHF09200.1 molecular chaperone GrpE [Dehalobacter restrictus DSM 9455]MCG1025797.1 nucleotide exchange factor GrpE [Dehalobacter sp.]MDJ0306459.1 nucleotide exchange factor GrpE [Dehalobacter sp.]OCZ51296.1 nucleotide exchange factor GrpE [Dehalobacter sp. TeCB1]QGZ99735.1 nucleotide exchange factor GrpE [Dehalobacter restrictus]